MCGRKLGICEYCSEAKAQGRKYIKMKGRKGVIKEIKKMNEKEGNLTCKEEKDACQSVRQIENDVVRLL